MTPSSEARAEARAAVCAATAAGDTPRAIRAAQELLRRGGAQDLSFLRREIEKATNWSPPLTPVKVALLSSFSIEFVEPALVVQGFLSGLAVQIHRLPVLNGLDFVFAQTHYSGHVAGWKNELAIFDADENPSKRGSRQWQTDSEGRTAVGNRFDCNGPTEFLYLLLHDGQPKAPAGSLREGWARGNSGLKDQGQGCLFAHRLRSLR